jgi:dienelactone hydrolase
MREVIEETRVLSLPGADVPVCEIRPSGAEKRPVVLFYHGLSADKEVHRKEGRSLAEAGFTAILPDAPHHGARRSARVDELETAERSRFDRLFLPIVQEGAAEVPQLLEHYLTAGHPAVAIAGVSMGAYIALAAGVAELRLAAIVSILGSPDWTPSSGVVPPELAQAVAGDPLRQRDRLVPRPLLLLNAGLDTNVPPGPARRLATALRSRYLAAGVPERLVHREYPESGHFPEERDWNDLWATTLGFLTKFVGR